LAGTRIQQLRVRQLNGAALRAGADYVLYWAQVNRRVESNQALTFAAQLANQLKLPLLFYEGLTWAYPRANDRLHTFVLEGIPETERRARALGLGYVFHLERRRSDPRNALYKLAEDAAALVTDDYPGFIAREYNARVPSRIGIPYYAVDASCIVPMAAIGKQEYAAYTIRPKIRKMLGECLRPGDAVRVERHWSAPPHALHTKVTGSNIAALAASSEIDHAVQPSREFRGGRKEAERWLKYFLEHNLRRYAAMSREPSEQATSRLSPYLHFGHISSLEVALAVLDYAARHKLSAEEFLEQLIVRRELAFNFARYGPLPDTLAALPGWARTTLDLHSADERDPLYARAEFERAETHDALWNATQRELLRDGVIHGYYRMYWGKKILEWSASPQDALDTMIDLHDRYALDGRDPNTYANILWCLGLHDRPWAERPVFGKVRYMSLEGMKRKTDVKAYIEHNP
jgi:deoxyribodipyrimidine photo-lyase